MCLLIFVHKATLRQNLQCKQLLRENMYKPNSLQKGIEFLSNFSAILVSKPNFSYLYHKKYRKNF